MILTINEIDEQEEQERNENEYKNYFMQSSSFDSTFLFVKINGSSKMEFWQ